jgi:methyl-accepting chemotaxis protein
LSDPTAATPSAGAPPAGPRVRHKRKLSNYLLDKKLQLRYVLIVTILSGVIAGILGFMIYQQRRAGAESIDENMTRTVEFFRAKGMVEQEKSAVQMKSDTHAKYASEDRVLVYKMVGVGVALVIILSLYLLIMTHKVAGPLFKVSMYFDRMSEGRLSKVTPLRQGDMLQDFYANFKEMHEAVRARAQNDVLIMERAVARLNESKNGADYRGEARDKLTEAVDGLAAHVDQRKKNLVDFPKQG